MKSQILREKFKNYFTDQDHLWVKSSTLIPEGNSSLLFTNAGMNPFKDFFLSLKKPPHPQICSIQKCMRAGGKHNDLEEVGYSPFHHTFFEMMGNFSFGSYFKKKAIDHALYFLTEELGLSRDRLWASVFQEDRESFEIWKKDQGFSTEKLFLLGEKDNFWRMGDTGPSGPCSEIYYYEGPKKEPNPEDMTEIWNLVFMEFNEFFKGNKKIREKLPTPCVDTGMGLERLSAVLQGQKSNYHTDLFKNIIMALEKTSGLKYDFTGEEEQGTQAERQVAFRVIADHSRAVSFLIGDGVLPGSEGENYVLRRVLRRALFYSHKLHSEKELLSAGAQAVIDKMSPIYPSLKKEEDFIMSIIKAENNLFHQSLQDGQNVFLKKIKMLSDKKIPEDMVWDLYNTYGFPPDLTCLIAREKGFAVNPLNLEDLKNRFSTVSKKQRHRLKDIARLKKTTTHKVVSDETKARFALLEQWNCLKIHESDILQCFEKKSTEFTGYEKSEEDGKVLLLPQIKEFSLADTMSDDPEKLELIFLSQLDVGELNWLTTDKTCFYPEGGGPLGDKGFFEWNYTDENGKKQEGVAKVLDAQKMGSLIFHAVKVLKGKLELGQLCKMKVDTDHRRLIAKSHSATHLLNQSLRVILGNSIRQMGSLVEPGKLRFDFSHPKPLSHEELKEIENKVKSYIQAGEAVTDKVCSYEQAISQGAISLAGENYAKEARTIRMGESFELCGGIHVKNTSEIGDFKIISETGVQSGVRRIQALTSEVLKKWFKLLAKQNTELGEYLNLPLTESAKSQNPFIHWFEEKESEIKKLKKELKQSFFSKVSSKKSGQDSSKSSKGKNYKHNSISGSVFLARQNEELRKYLKLPLPKLKAGAEKNKEEQSALETLSEKENPFISVAKKKEEEIDRLKTQIESLSSSFNPEKVLKNAKVFKGQNIKGELLMTTFPIEDRKILAEKADQLKSKLSGPALVIALGEKAEGHPIVVTVSKELRQHISAGDLLKNILAPRLNGKGGGKPRFAQGTIKNKSGFLKMEKVLLDILNSK